jgi:4-hydroxy-3-methylbut-2-enyl diphosphate reductase
MEILIAKHSGFCEGVERAYRIALEHTQAGKNVFMLGNLVHNKQVVEKFDKLGAKTVRDILEIPLNSKGILIISAHGVPPEVYERAKGLGLEIVDTTCAWVKKAQRIANELAEEGRTIIIVGDKGHKEVVGLVGWSGGRGKVIEDIKEIQWMGDIQKIKDSKVGILAQTTQSEEHFQKIVAEIKKLAKDTKVFDTICGATSKRQKAAIELAKAVDLVLVIGDRMSANTKRLTELCSQAGTETHQIETVSDLNSAWLKGKEKIGITAGASTPEWVIDGVIANLRNLP